MTDPVFEGRSQHEPAPIAFRSLTLADLLLMHRWLNTDHVKQWWGKDGISYTKVVEEYTPSMQGKEPTRPYIILHTENPIGYIQTYPLDADYGAPPEVGENAAGVDLFIGDPDYAYQGLGAPILRAFLHEVVFVSMDAQSCLIDPDPRNTRAIRAYEKAGFRYLATIRRPQEAEPAYLMIVRRDDAD